MFIISLILCLFLKHILTENNQKLFNLKTLICGINQYSTKVKKPAETQVQNINLN